MYGLPSREAGPTKSIKVVNRRDCETPSKHSSSTRMDNRAPSPVPTG
ncbi:hypothetical protein ABIB66_008204 [Bradyrhizobium sp. F1.13.3]